MAMELEGSEGELQLILEFECTPSYRDQLDPIVGLHKSEITRGPSIVPNTAMRAATGCFLFHLLKSRENRSDKHVLHIAESCVREGS